MFLRYPVKRAGYDPIGQPQRTLADVFVASVDPAERIGRVQRKEADDRDARVPKPSVVARSGSDARHQPGIGDLFPQRRGEGRPVRTGDPMRVRGRPAAQDWQRLPAGAVNV